MIADRAATRDWLASLCLFALALFFFSENNRFPYTYHPDEPVKAHQIVTGERWFYHPLLLLTSANWVAELAGLKPDAQAVVVAGRWCSALFGAFTVLILAWLARRWTGWPGFVITGLFLTANAQLYELAHYCKEDPALLVGMAAVMLALDVFWTKPTRWTALAVGGSCGLAMSGKYIGAIMLVVALPILFAAGRDRRGLFFGYAFLGLTAVWLLFNHPVFLDPGAIASGLSREIAKVAQPEMIEESFPNWRILNSAWALVPLVSLAGLLAWAARFVSHPEFRSPIRTLFFVFPLLYVAILLFWPKASERYLLPATVFFVFTGCVGLTSWLRFGTGKVWQISLTTLLLLVAYVLTSGHDIRKARKDFRTDQRVELRDWIVDNLPVQAAFATDHRVQLRAERSDHFARVESAAIAADLGSIEELQARGITHVIVGGTQFRDFLKMNPGNDKPGRRARFYQQLEADFPVVWEKSGGRNRYLHPGLIVFEITSPKK